MNCGSLEPGASLSVTCPMCFTVKLSNDKKTVALKCAPLSRPTTSLLPSATVLPPSVPTATRTSGPTTVATSTTTSLPILPPMATTTATPFLATSPAAISSPKLPPTATAAPSSVVLSSVDPVIPGTCLPAVHDQYTVVGPDGKTYRTWHPVIVPLDPNDPRTIPHTLQTPPKRSLPTFRAPSARPPSTTRPGRGCRPRSLARPTRNPIRARR